MKKAISMKDIVKEAEWFGLSVVKSTDGKPNCYTLWHMDSSQAYQTNMTKKQLADVVERLGK